MAMKREATHIDGNKSMVELLVALQLDGHLDSAALPPWAKGTSVEEIFKAVRSLGDGAWLEPLYPGNGPYEAADRWLAAYLSGDEVPVKADAAACAEPPARHSGGEDVGDEAEAEAEREQSLRALEEYANGLPPKRAKLFRAKLAVPAYLEQSVAMMDAASQALAAAYVMPDEDFVQAQKSLIFLKPANLKDAEIAALAKHYIVENYKVVFEQMIELDFDMGRAVRRAKALGTKLGKAIEKAQSRPT